MRAQAEENLEARPINTTAAAAKEADESVPQKSAPRAPALYPPLPSDPIYDVVRTLRAGVRANLSATLITHEEIPSAKPAEWHFPHEEITSVTRPAAPVPGGVDPENARLATDGDDTTPVAIPTQAPVRPNPFALPKTPAKTVTAAPLKRVDSDVPGEPRIPTVSDRADTDSTLNSARPTVVPSVRNLNASAEPEAGRFLDASDGPDTKPATASLKPTADPQKGLAERDESPRIVSGSSLDAEDPKPAAPLAALKQPAASAPAPVVAEPLASAQKRDDVNDDAAPQGPQPVKAGNAPKATAKVASGRNWSAQDTLGSGKTDPKSQAAADASGKSLDPEERTAQLLKEILEKQKQLAEMVRDANKRLAPVVNPKDGTVIRGDHERKIFSTLIDAKRPLGAVAVKVFDPKTKQPLAARVRLIDSTEAPARAPLSTGFWCRGSTPGINVVSGLVRAEINHGGRFWGTFIKGLEVTAGKVLPLDVPVNQPPELDFAKHGWFSADLDIGIRKQPGEDALWFGTPPTINDLILGAKAEGVRVLGVSLPLGDENAMNQFRTALENPDPDVLLIPVFPGPRNLFHGAGCGLGVTNWEGIKATSSVPEIPLRDGFDAIRANGGLAVFKNVNGLRTAVIDTEILPFYRRLKDNNYFNGTHATQAHLYGAAELPFDTITGGYDVFAFDGSEAMEAVWFNLLNENAPVRVMGAGGGSLEGGRIPFGQTFLQIEGKPTREKVMQSIVEGRSMVSFGPAAFCKVYERDMGPGSILPTDGRALNFQIRAFATLAPGAQLDKVEIIRNGKVVYTQAAAEGESEIIDLRWPLSETANAWYLVRVTERIGHETDRSSVKYRRAWTSPIFFRNAAATPFDPSVSRVHGVMRKGLTPIRGTVTALATGMPTQRVESAADGSFSIALPSTGTLIFEATDCDPAARRIFEHPRVQNAIGKLMAADDVSRNLADRPVFGLWRLLLSDLEWDITLAPSATPTPIAPPRLPEAQ